MRQNGAEWTLTTLIWCRVFTNNTFLVRLVSGHYRSMCGIC
jgi:hypothetical protein